MRRLLVVLLLAAGMVLVNPSVALACSCVRLSAEQLTKEADTVAVGTVQWTSTNGIDRTYGVSFDQVYKGIAGLREKILTPSQESACGLGELATNEQYIFFLDGKHPGQMRATSCTGTTKLDVATLDAVESVTGSPVEPFSSFDSGPAVPADSVDPVRAVGIGAIVLAALFGAAVLIRQRRRGGGGRQYLG